MEDMAPITERAVLLAQAIELCSSLASVLDKLGPSRFIPRVGDDKLLEISTLEETLHRRFQRVSEHRNRALAPISRLPDDVLRYIFTTASEAAADHTQLRVALTVTWVCRIWRVVAVDTAKLWAYATVPIEHAHYNYRSPSHHYMINASAAVLHPWYDSTEFKANESMDETMLARSKRAHMRLCLSVPYPGEPQVPESFLTSHGDRVESLSMNLDVPINLTPLEVVDEHLPWILAARSNLRSLAIARRYPDGRPGFRVLVDNVMNIEMPLLTDLYIVSLPLPTPSTTHFCAVTHCKKMCLIVAAADTMSLDGFSVLLQSSQQLKELSITLSATEISYGPPNAGLATVSLPHLTDFSVSGGRFITIPLMTMIAPSLLNLSLDATFSTRQETDANVADVTAAVQRFLQVSAARVESIAIEQLPVRSLLEILPFLPDIRRFTFTPGSARGGMDHEYFELLQGDSTPLGANICPRLEELCFPQLDIMQSLDALNRIFQARKQEQGEVKAIPRFRLGYGRHRPSDPSGTRIGEKQLAEEVGELVVEKPNGPSWIFDKGKGAWTRSTATFHHWL